MVDSLQVRGMLALTVMLFAAACSPQGDADPPVITPEQTPPIEPLTLGDSCKLINVSAYPWNKADHMAVTASNYNKSSNYCDFQSSGPGGRFGSLTVRLVSWRPLPDRSSSAISIITDDVRSGKCQELDGIADIACWNIDGSIVSVRVARKNTIAELIFRLPGVDTEESALKIIPSVAQQTSAGMG